MNPWRAPSLRQVLAGVKIKAEIDADLLDTLVRGVSSDSRQFNQGFLFVALSGQDRNGHDYLADVAAQGALAALVQVKNPQIALPQLETADTRAALAAAAMNFYGRPAENLRVIAVTGTNGKTTTSFLIEALLAPDCGLIGTVEIHGGGPRRPSHMTTPDPMTLAAILAEMQEHALNNLVMEVSSHALEQKRVDGLAFDGAVFTNFSRDHLDYHLSMDNYLRAKMRLFGELLPAARRRGKKSWAVFNAGDSVAAKLENEIRAQHIPFINYGRQGMVFARQASCSLEGTRAEIHTPQGEITLTSPLIGDFNLQNMLAAVAAGLCMDMSLSAIADNLRQCPPIPGRLQRVNEGPGPVTLVDYAHSDDALRKVLAVIKPLCPGRLICVFGAGGNRDQGKRPLMGQAAAELADILLVTSDNPRREDPNAIIDMIIPGIVGAGFSQKENFGGGGKFFIRQPDRETAINLAIAEAKEEDVVVIAGKGHETCQIIGEQKWAFDDREKAAAALQQRKR
jgi:UDP-N-acetylmuramoyl-L-alanyl-D-glutamate--2,6-diaminopimelate ligase